MELTIGASYPARLSGPISVKMEESHALMVYIPYSLVGTAFSEIHALCIGTKDGVYRELVDKNLRKIFPEWTDASPFELQKVQPNESGEAQFTMADWAADSPWVNKKGETVQNYSFKWINELNSGIRQSTDAERAAAESMWGAKWGKPAAPTPHDTSKPKVVEAEAVKPATPKRGRPATAAKIRTSSAEEVMELLVKKYHPNGASDDEQQALGDKYYFPAQDELFGVNVAAETPEQWGAVADKLGL